MKNIISFCSLVVLALLPNVAFAAEEGGVHAGGIVGIGASIAIGLAALGGALGQGKLASSGLEGISRNPGASNKIFVPLLLGLAFVESLVILAFVVALQLLGKV